MSRHRDPVADPPGANLYRLPDIFHAAALSGVEGEGIAHRDGVGKQLFVFRHRVPRLIPGQIGANHPGP